MDSPEYHRRRMSKDSGRCSLTPSIDNDPQRRFSVESTQYRKISVDSCISKDQTERNSSPNLWDSDGSETPTIKDGASSPAVMRFWKNAAGADEEEGEQVEENDENNLGKSCEPAWKSEALEGDLTEFPSIRDKIANMEDVGKTIGIFNVPDVKSKMKTQTAPAAGWMEARSKLQTQLDSLIAKTSAKISKYGSVHAQEPKVVVKEKTPEQEDEGAEDQNKRSELISLVKSVANEIQRSFSAKNILDDKDENEMDENNNEEACTNNNKLQYIQPQIDMEAPIDFDYLEPVPEPKPTDQTETHEENTKVETLEAEEGIENIKVKEESLDNNVTEDKSEEHEDQDGVAVMESVHSAARSKLSIMRRTTSAKRLPSKLAARKSSSQVDSLQQIKKELIDASMQVDLNEKRIDLDSMNDEEKLDLIVKQMSAMDSDKVMEVLKHLESGVLDISVPMLIPYLSLQVKLDMGVNIFKNLESQSKVKVVKEHFIQDMIEDITDIALLQEVIDRTQEKINYLNSLRVVDMENYFSIEDDSFELPIVSSSTNVASKKTQDVKSKSVAECKKDKEVKKVEKKEEKMEEETKVNEKKKSTQDIKSKTVAECKKDKEVKKV